MRYVDGLDPNLQRQIQADERYAPLIALLEAWQGEIDGHLDRFEENVFSRLTGELTRRGDWRFPMQSLIVPELPGERDITPEISYRDVQTHTRWTAAGFGRTRATRLGRSYKRQRGFDEYVLLCDIDVTAPQPDRFLRTPEAGKDELNYSQLAFVPGSEAVVSAMSKAEWGIQYPGESFQPLIVTRYRGYLDFEHRLAASRAAQRHLDVWLPAFSVFSRKFLRFSLPANNATQDQWEADKWEWLGEAQSVRIAARLPREIAGALPEQASAPDKLAYDPQERRNDPLILNAIPVYQMRTETSSYQHNPIRPLDEQGVSFLNKLNCFASSGIQTSQTDAGVRTIYLTTRLHQNAAVDPLAKPGLVDADVLCDASPDDIQHVRLSIHYGCEGELAASPSVLAGPGSARYHALFPILGGMTAPIGGFEDVGSRSVWYEAMLKPQQITMGDLIQILRLRPSALKYFDLAPDKVQIRLDVESQPQQEQDNWGNFLWPSLVSDRVMMEQRAGNLTKPGAIPVLPVMTLFFNRTSAQLPGFLQDDLARYAASLVSRNLMQGWYRVQGQIRD